MSDELRKKLSRLGIRKGAAQLKPPPPPTRQAMRGQALRDVSDVLDGREIETPNGPSWIVEDHFNASYRHGSRPLADALELPADVLGRLACADPAWGERDLSRAAFLDTETTGLAGGTGTLAFLVGVGRFKIANRKSQEGEFQLAQFFLRQPGEEAALLAALSEHVADCEAVVTFNGRGFDLPLLRTRFMLNHQPPALTVPHLDLLPPARRLWRERLPSCALSSLESHVLDVHRDQVDAPGYLIPQLYFDYLNTGDASALGGVLYHNAQDILSMVTLATRLGGLFAEPLAEPSPDPGDLVSLAGWYDELGWPDRAEMMLHAVLDRDAPLTVQAAAWQRLGFLCKHQGRYEDARQAWERLAATSQDLTAHVELAKHYEWRAHEHDLKKALSWTQVALDRIETWPPGYARDQVRGELLHRQQRLERKLGHG
ncbi:MAG: ribonuclease H-like domain-containing protein [Thermoflexales bacterium]|nr:ribonuclease H-like domain-containing protein [Thermoflexales bacterium]